MADVSRTSFVTRYAWRRGIYRAVTVLGLLWILAVAAYAIALHEWRRPDDVAQFIGWRVAHAIKDCGKACAEVSGTNQLESGPGERLIELVGKVDAELSAGIVVAKKRMRDEELREAEENAKARIPEDGVSAELRELEQRAASAKERYEAARKRFELGQGDSIRNELAMFDARRIHESAEANLREKREAKKRSTTPVTTWRDFNPNPALDLIALEATRTSVAQLDVAKSYKDGLAEAAKQRNYHALAMVAAALLPILAVVIAIETLAWVLRGFAKT